MQWKDLFYFSKGERHALTVLVLLITLTWILLQYCSEDKTISVDSSLVNPVFAQTVHTSRQKQEKFTLGTIINLNEADTTTLKKIPGIGSVFANRIIKYRNLLGGFYNIEQLREVYGIEDDKFSQLKDWFKVENPTIKKIYINLTDEAELRKHPYINYKQARAINQLLKQKKRITGWENLILLEEFSVTDQERLKHYLDFGTLSLP